MRSPGIEPGSTAWKATMLTITPATRAYCTASPLSLSKGAQQCILRGSNPRGLCPMGLKSIALTTRPRMRAQGIRALALSPAQPRVGRRDSPTTKKRFCSQSETRTHNLPVNSRARCRLRHPGTCCTHHSHTQPIELLIEIEYRRVSPTHQTLRPTESVGSSERNQVALAALAQLGRAFDF
jgi:hypothetical protein